MARIEHPGVGLQLPDEREVRLANVLAGLGLRPLDEKELHELRTEIGFALGRWRESNSGVHSGDVARRMRKFASQLENMKCLLTAVDKGLHRQEDIQAAMLLASALRGLPTISGVEAAHEHIGRFREMAADVSIAMRVAAQSLDSIKVGNKPQYDWHDSFVLAIAKICQQNGIDVKKVSSRKFDEPSGRFFEVVAAFEQLLLPKMRTRTAAALAKRINRSLDRLGSATLPQAPT